MRPILLSTLILLLLAAVSCSKDSDTPNYKYKLEGTWELHKTVWAQEDSIYAPDNGHLLVFTPQNFESFEDGQRVDSGSYIITNAEEKPDIFNGAISLNGAQASGFYLHGDTLMLGGLGFVYNASFYIRKPDL
ncbi:MAG TPA: hypothetical protein VL053_11800 [Arachidicoccus sp.]|nr:hypothetical protein [Arachidicoccus sp.]